MQEPKEARKAHFYSVEEQDAHHEQWLQDERRRQSQAESRLAPWMFAKAVSLGHRQRSLHRWEESCKRKLAEERGVVGGTRLAQETRQKSGAQAVSCGIWHQGKRPRATTRRLRRRNSGCRHVGWPCGGSLYRRIGKQRMPSYKSNGRSSSNRRA